MLITQAEVREAFSYDPDTGVLTDRATGQAAGIDNGNGYLRVQFKGRRWLVHRLIWLHVTGSWPKAALDHRNHVRFDNRWENLREATWAQNNQHRVQVSRASKSGFTGVYQRGNRWVASISANGERLFLGVHSTPEAAHGAYLAAKALHHRFDAQVTS